MDPNSSTRRPLSPPNYTDQGLIQLSRFRFRRFGSTTLTLTKILASCLVALPVLFVLSLMLRHRPYDWLLGLGEARVIEIRNYPNDTVFSSLEVGLGEFLQHFYFFFFFLKLGVLFQLTKNVAAFCVKLFWVFINF